jgi:hypothetical protein
MAIHFFLEGGAISPILAPEALSDWDEVKLVEK